MKKFNASGINGHTTGPINRNSLKIAVRLAMIAGGIAAGSSAFAQQTPAIEEVVVMGQSRTFANSSATQEMQNQVSAASSVLGAIDYIPGVMVNEGDAFGGDDWSTTISIRGFQVSLDEQQLGTTIDGIPNGNSNYGGGAKANRFLDTENLGGVDVVQGTSDIASWSHEALGGSMNFRTLDPQDTARLTTSATVGDFDARKLFARYDTGEIFANTYGWISMSGSDINSWIDESGESNRDHIAAKLKSSFNGVDLTAYISYDDTHEDNYERITPQEFREDPTWDRLTGNWTGIPHIDQQYRRAWSTLRKNLLAYGKAEFEVSGIDFSTSVYHHDNSGRGDWIPPYIVNVTNDGAGAPHSELRSGTTVRGGSPLGTITFVDRDGRALSPIAGCTSSITWPYGGASAAYDPACFAPGALPVSSYRHTVYEKQRTGFIGDFAWETASNDLTNTLRGGLWFENSDRNEKRHWLKVIDSRTSMNFNKVPYWEQYDRSFPQKSTTWYLEDTLEIGDLTARLGIKQYLLDIDREDEHQGGRRTGSVNSDSDVLFSGGLVYTLPVDGMEVFAGYAESFSAIKDGVLEANQTALESVEPETADSMDIGLRYNDTRYNASLTYYDIKFKNRITYIPEGSGTGIDYLGESDGSYVNVGGIKSTGIEAAVQARLTDQLSLYFSYTNNDSTYIGTPSAAANTLLGVFPGNTVFGSAEDMFVISTDWQRDNYAAGLTYKKIGERWLDAGNTQRLDGYGVADLYVSVDLTEQLQGLQAVNLRLNVSNLTDKSYLGGVAGGWGGWIAPPRTATATLSVAF
ncbi:MAG: TonB-dependent receptor [Pseudohongiella sp.]|nr:TonB-dependent receptor [Pseudohongiella sp.]